MRCGSDKLHRMQMRVMASCWFSLGKLCVCVSVFSRCLHGDVAFNRQSKADISLYLHLSWIKSTFSIYSKPEKTSCGHIWIPFLHFSLFLWALAMDGCVCNKLCDTLVIKFGKLWWGLYVGLIWFPHCFTLSWSWVSILSFCCGLLYFSGSLRSLMFHSPSLLFMALGFLFDYFSFCVQSVLVTSLCPLISASVFVYPSHVPTSVWSLWTMFPLLSLFSVLLSECILVLVSMLVTSSFILTVPHVLCVIFGLASLVPSVRFCSAVFPGVFTVP